MNIGYLFLFLIIFIIIGYLLGSMLFGIVISRIMKIDLRSVGSGNMGSTNIVRNCGRPAGIVTFIWDSLKGWLSIFISYSILVNARDLIGNIEGIGFIIYFSGLFAMIGHCWPIQFLIILLINKFNFSIANNYKGGKGAATTAGILIAVSPWVFLISFSVFWILFFIKRYVSLSSLIAISLSTFLFLIPNLNYLYMLCIFGDSTNIIQLSSVENEFLNPSISYMNYSIYMHMIFFILLLNNIIVIYKHKENIKRLLQGKENRMEKKENL